MADFQESLVVGLELETKVLNMIRKKYPCATLIQAFKGYDIWIPETNEGVEVKRDVKSTETGNLVVEIEMNGKPSALFTTKASWWVFHDGEMFAWIRPLELMKLIMLGNYKWAEFVGNGDTKSKKAYLIPKGEIYKNCALLRNKYGETIKNERQQLRA